MPNLAAIIIGRNEGQRLAACLDSLLPHVPLVIYVDSGSTDGSIALARARGASVVELDTSIPFTAARARNAGLDRLLQLAPDTTYVQFADGDTRLQPGWLPSAVAAFESNPALAVVAGRRREIAPDASRYNTLCDLEWDTPVGEASACGGDAFMRVAALRQVGGFNPALIAGEEPELCFRLRGKGWKILRLDAEMTLHDAAITRFSQWARRTARAGYAFTLGSQLHGRSPERYWVRETRSITFWGIVLPLLALALAWPTRGLSLVLLLAYPALALRIARSARRRGLSSTHARLYATYCVLGKFPQALGQLKCYSHRLTGRTATLIEYKTT